MALGASLVSLDVGRAAPALIAIAALGVAGWLLIQHRRQQDDATALSAQAAGVSPSASFNAAVLASLAPSPRPQYQAPTTQPVGGGATIATAHTGGSV